MGQRAQRKSRKQTSFLISISDDDDDDDFSTDDDVSTDDDDVASDTNENDLMRNRNNGNEFITSPKSSCSGGEDFSKILAHNFSEMSPSSKLISNNKKFDPFDFCHHEGFNMAKQGRLNDVEKMIKRQKATIHDIDRHGNTMLYYGCLTGHFGVVRYLLELGARDDKFSRCYLNSLSQEMRTLLKTYHNYSFATKKKAESDDNGVIEDDSLVNLLLSFVKRAIFSNQEGGDDSDMTLTIQFVDEQIPTSYRLQKWILISRWPELINFALSDTAENPLSKSSLIQLSLDALVAYNLDPREYEREVHCYYYSSKPSKTRIGISVDNAKQYVSEKFQPIQLPNLSEEQIESVYEKLSDINLGLAPFRRKEFEVCLAYIYTGRIIDPRVKSTFIPLEKVTTRGNEIPFLVDLIDAAYSLKMISFAKLLFTEVGIHTDVISKKFKVKAIMESFQEGMKKKLQHDLSPLGFCFESKKPTNLIDILRRRGCDMKISLADSIEEPSEKESRDFILCHKKFITKRCQYFDIMLSCGFSEGIQFREEEEKNGIATLELNCPNMEILTQIINYTYSENAEITTSICIELSIQSQKLDYIVLYRKCEDFMIENLTISDAADMFELYKLATFLGSEKLKKFWKPQTIKYVANQIEQGNTSINQVRETLLTELECNEEECQELLSQINDKLF